MSVRLDEARQATELTLQAAPRDGFGQIERDILRREHGLTVQQIDALELRLDGVYAWLRPKPSKADLLDELSMVQQAAQTLEKFFSADPANTARWEAREELLVAMGCEWFKPQADGSYPRAGAKNLARSAKKIADGSIQAQALIEEHYTGKGYAAPHAAIELIVEALRAPTDDASRRAADFLDPVNGNATMFRKLVSLVVSVATGREATDPRKIVDAFVDGERLLSLALQGNRGG